MRKTSDTKLRLWREKTAPVEKFERPKNYGVLGQINEWPQRLEILVLHEVHVSVRPECEE